MQGLAQQHGREAHRDFRLARLSARRGRYFHAVTTLLRLAVDEREQVRVLLLALLVRLDFAVLAGPDDLIDLTGAPREVLVDVAPAIRDGGNTASLRQHFPGACRSINPALRLLLRGRARAA